MCYVLLVEDSKPQHYVVQKSLSALGSDVDLHIVETLADAKRILEDGCVFDVIILDLGLPDSNGVDSFIELQTVCCDIPVVVCTADETAATALECIRRGAETVIIKPALQALARIVAYAVERKRVRKTLEEMVRNKMVEVTCGYHRDIESAKENLRQAATALGVAKEDQGAWVASETTPTNCG